MFQQAATRCKRTGKMQPYASAQIERDKSATRPAHRFSTPAWSMSCAPILSSRLSAFWLLWRTPTLTCFNPRSGRWRQLGRALRWPLPFASRRKVEAAGIEVRML